MATVYIETSIVSYLVSRPSMHLITLARQHLTQHWWGEHRHEHDLFASQFVLDEAARGDPEYAAKRLKVLEKMALLGIEPEIPQIAEELLVRTILPQEAGIDALHISTASYHEIEYLLTWNCKHIANGRILPRIYGLLNELGYHVPLICTIEEMMGDDNPLR
ncbi:MAG: type II toxin-antitoxin system VapC family toxin [Pirellulales bacterium]